MALRLLLWDSDPRVPVPRPLDEEHHGYVLLFNGHNAENPVEESKVHMHSAFLSSPFLEPNSILHMHRSSTGFACVDR